MKRCAFIFAFLLGLLPFCMAQSSGEKNFIDQNYMEVTGIAEMQIVPDEIYLKIVIGDKDQKGKVGMEQLEGKMFDMLKKVGVDVKQDLSVREVASNLKSYMLKSAEIKTMKEYVLLVRNTKLLNEIFRGLDKIGISDASVERVDHSAIEKFRREVKINAIKVAKEKAQALADAIGQTVGRAIYINEMDWRGMLGAGAQNVSNMQVLYNVENGNSDPVIEFEKIKLEARIIVRFELK